jgi:AsmA family
VTKKILWVVLIVATLVMGVPHLPASLFQPSIARALERSLGRKVEVGEVHLSLYGMPGFTIDDVTIHEDPRSGIEPFAYVQTLGADVSLLGLLHRRLEFSTIRLGDASINLVKADAGPWNFQYLLNSPAAASGSIPAIKMKAGRVNFKFGDTKSVFYFDDADLSVSPNTDGSVELRFGGAPSRTDRSAQKFGHFFVTGSWLPQRQNLDLKVELERSSLEEVLKLADSSGYGIHGVVAMEARLTGPTSDLDVSGDFQLEDLHRWDLLPDKTGGWRQRYHGTLDLRGEKLELKTVSDTPNPPLTLDFQAANYLTVPKWQATADVHDVPLATILEVARHMGAPLPEKLSAQGPVSGSITYGREQGFSGDLAISEASLNLPDSPPLKASAVQVSIKDGAARMDPATVQIGEGNSVQVEASYTTAKEDGLDLKVSTRGLSVADTRGFGLKAIPLLEHTPQGTWRGWARYHAGDWTGEYELQNARVAVDGLAEPLQIQSAAVSLTGNRAAANRLRAKIGDISFTGDYRWEPNALRPHKFRVQIDEADLSELNRLLAPTLSRQAGFLETLRFSSAPLPAWLKGRRAEGTISIGDLNTGDKTVHITKARLLWDEARIIVDRVDATLEDSPISGTLLVNLEGRQPKYHAEGKLEDVPYKGGKLDFDGTVEAEGSGLPLLLTAHAEGSFKGRSVSFTPDVDFRTVTGRFEFKSAAWKLSNVEIVQGSDLLTGAGASQPDGKLVLDLSSKTRQFRYSSTLLAAGAPGN